MSKKITIVLLCLLNFGLGKAQQSVLFEAGGTYFTNEFRQPKHVLLDFAGLTLNTRILFRPQNNSCFSVDLPVSIRSKNRGDDLTQDQITTRFGLHIPVLFTYNYGAGASGNPSEKKWGLAAGTGWAYFYQKGSSFRGEEPNYNESVSFSGPIAQIGVRRVLIKTNLFRINNKDVHPAVALKFSRQFDVKGQHRDIGMLSLLLGIAF
jgi:hypothetical protein